MTGHRKNQSSRPQALAEMKQGGEPQVFSKPGTTWAYCYDAARVMKWLDKQAITAFRVVGKLQ